LLQITTEKDSHDLTLNLRIRVLLDSSYGTANVNNDGSLIQEPFSN
jgi:hypothetical protein